MELSAAVNHDTHRESYFLFEENKGQFHANVLFTCRLPNGYLYLEQNGLTYLFENGEDMSALMHEIHEHQIMGPFPRITVRGHSVKVRFENSLKAEVSGDQQLLYYYNYFTGADPKKWQSNVHLYRRVIYREVYPGVSLVFYTDEKGSLKYDWIVSASGRHDHIDLSFEGADSLFVRHDSLFIETSCGNIIETPPVIYVEAGASAPPCSFQLNENHLTYRIPEQLPNLQDTGSFVIDPALIFSTYSGSRGDNFGFTATYDSKGNLYAGGITNGAQGKYPVTAGAVQTDYGGGGIGLPAAGLPCDITISKYDSAGTKLLWATYVGGENNEYPHSLVVNQDDDLYIFGTTYSDDYPTSEDGYDRTFNGIADIIVTKISEDGTTLLGSTYVGGSSHDGLNSSGSLRYNYADDFRGDILPDENKDVFIASCTRSTDFPLVKAIDSTMDIYEGVILQLNSDLSKLKWSTFLGGNGPDALYSVKVDLDSTVYVCGGTTSTDLPASDNAIHKDLLGNVDGYLAAIDRRNYTLKELTYWGTTSYDQVYFIDLNQEGSVFVAGQTTGNIKPSSSTIYGEPNKGQFIAKLDTSLANVEWQTSFGVRDNRIDISPSAFLVDNCEHIYMSGWGSNVDPNAHPGSTNGLETSANAVQKTTDNNDFYLLVLDKDAQGLLYATYFGGDSSDDHVDGGTSRFDKKGVVYQSVCSSCPEGSDPGRQDFPVTPNAAFTENFSPRCSNASFKIDLQIKSDVDAYFVPNPIIGCQPVTVDFDNRSDIAQKFYWDFGDGSMDSSTLHPTHTYNTPGVYEVTLTVIDSNTCNISDVFKRRIEVVGKTPASFEYTLDPCTFKAEFEATSKAFTYLWDLGNGDMRSQKKFDYTFQPGSTNPVTLYVDLGTLCADSITKVITIEDGASRDIFIPNIFTPNNDGFNDEYCIDGYLDGCDEIELTIFNRWGERVFKTTEIGKCWDGRVDGKQTEHPSGTYFYILEVTEGKFSLDSSIPPRSYKRSGTVTLLHE